MLFIGNGVGVGDLGLLLVVVIRSLLDHLVSLSALNHTYLGEMREEVGPHYVMLFRQILARLVKMLAIYLLG